MFIPCGLTHTPVVILTLDDRVLLRCIQTIQRCISEKLKYKFWRVPELEKSIKRCAKEMNRARTDFDVRRFILSRLHMG